MSGNHNPSLDRALALVEAAVEAGAHGLKIQTYTADTMTLDLAEGEFSATPEHTHLRTIPHLRELFDCEVGLSDHTLGIGVALASVALASVALGATVIEKHFTLRRADGGVDSAFSLEPEELRALVVESARAWQA
ncbi:MAG: N-acetylneuraminate synthase family protein, partial [Candidatus Competibacteraceae bacterium]